MNFLPVQPKPSTYMAVVLAAAMVQLYATGISAAAKENAVLSDAAVEVANSLCRFFAGIATRERYASLPDAWVASVEKAFFELLKLFAELERVVDNKNKSIPIAGQTFAERSAQVQLTALSRICRLVGDGSFIRRVAVLDRTDPGVAAVEKIHTKISDVVAKLVDAPDDEKHKQIDLFGPFQRLLTGVCGTIVCRIASPPVGSTKLDAFHADRVSVAKATAKTAQEISDEVAGKLGAIQFMNRYENAQPISSEALALQYGRDTDDEKEDESGGY